MIFFLYMHQNQNDYFLKKKKKIFQQEKLYESGIGEDNVNNVVVSRNYADYSTVVAKHNDHVVVAAGAGASSKTHMYINRNLLRLKEK